MNDGAIELSAASWQRRAGSADKGAVITDKKIHSLCSTANESDDHQAWERRWATVSMALE